MKQIVNEQYQEQYIEETLDNGLHVVLWHKPDYAKSLFLMATPLGAMDMEQEDEAGNVYQFPAGIAHFLEHKMFEMDDCDVMDRFSQLGANVNAFTSYSDTAYYFSTTSDIEAPLNLLLDFVQELNIKEESVEKEKGIIIQELNMYQQMSDNRLLMETFSSLYQKHPLRYDIGGDDASVTATSLDQLETCYRINYHPSKMVLVGVSSEDPEKLMGIIKKNQASKDFTPIQKVNRLAFEEPTEVARPEYQFTMDVSVPKVSIAYKFKGIADVEERSKVEWCIKIMLDAYFSSLHPAYQTWLDEEIINDYVGCDVDFGSDYGMIMFYGETKKKDAFIDIVAQTVEQIKKGEIDAAIVEQLKRRYFGQMVRSLNSFDDIAITYARAFFDHMDVFKSMDIVQDIKSDAIRDVCLQLSFDERCLVELMPEKEM